MDLRIEMYERIFTIQKHSDKEIMVVRHAISKKLYIMKILAKLADLTLYEQLLTHPHIHMANIIEFMQDEQHCYIIEEYVNGITLEYAMSAKTLTSALKKQILYELFDVLEHLHQLQPPIIHRDIKPANIMLENNHVKLIDFEIARNVVPEKNRDTQIMGSVGYASPEQYGFAQSDQRSDIYALGMLMKELFAHTDDENTYQFIIDRCLKMDPAARYESIGELRCEFMCCDNEKLAHRYLRKKRFQSYQIVGLRKDPLWVKVLVVLYTVIALVIAKDAKTTDPNEAVVSLFLIKLCMAFIILLFMWIPTNSFHLLELTPLYRSKYKIVRVLNGCIIWFVISVIALFATALLASILTNISLLLT